MKPGRKDDTGKIRWNLFPWRAAEDIVKVLMFGADKYEDTDNWKRVPDARNRYFAAGVRHFTAWFAGEQKDPETGYSHLAHLGACVIFLIELDRSSKEEPKGK